MQDRFECVRNDFDRAPIPRRAARPWYDPAMRRLARWTLNALTVLSLLLCVATAGLSVRSYWYETFVSSGDYSLDASRGSVLYTKWPAAMRRPNDPPRFMQDVRRPQSTSSLADQMFYIAFDVHSVAGFRTGTVMPGRLPYLLTRLVLIPLWPACGITALLPMMRLVGATRKWRRMRSKGRCRSCSYDLTGNVSGVCPECGTSVAKAPSPPAESFR
jgi:hypothetical protein